MVLSIKFQNFTTLYFLSIITTKGTKYPLKLAKIIIVIEEKISPGFVDINIYTSWYHTIENMRTSIKLRHISAFGIKTIHNNFFFKILDMEEGKFWLGMFLEWVYDDHAGQRVVCCNLLQRISAELKPMIRQLFFGSICWGITWCQLFRAKYCIWWLLDGRGISGISSSSSVILVAYSLGIRQEFPKIDDLDRKVHSQGMGDL